MHLRWDHLLQASQQMANWLFRTCLAQTPQGICTGPGWTSTSPANSNNNRTRPSGLPLHLKACAFPSELLCLSFSPNGPTTFMNPAASALSHELSLSKRWLSLPTEKYLTPSGQNFGQVTGENWHTVVNNMHITASTSHGWELWNFAMVPAAAAGSELRSEPGLWACS